jgi:tRNA(Ile)-lysidine synthase
MDLVQRVEHVATHRRLLARDGPVLLAVSGGLDSMVLLHVLARLAPDHGWRLAVAHFNHHLRGKESDADERLVKRAALKLRLPITVGQGNVKEFSAAHSISLEMAARKLRHEFLATVAKKRGIQTVALAHHADDQVELFLLRLLRGAGGAGLAGMKWRGPSPENHEVTLVRPMLEETRESLSAWAARERIPFREDATNALLDFQRNRIRHELLPLLARHYQSAVSRVLLRQMELIGAESDFVREAAAKWLRRPRGKFSRLPIAVQRQCVQLELSRLGVAPNFDLVERLRQSEDQAVTVSEGVSVSRIASGKLKSHRISTTGDRPKSPSEGRYSLKGRTGKIRFAGRTITWNLEPCPPGGTAIAKKRVNLEHFDADKLGAVIVLRHWRPGDRFQPIGMEWPVKLQDMFVNQKIPRSERRQLVVATTGAGELFWVEGQRMAERFKLDKSTQRRLKWAWKRL